MTVLDPNLGVSSFEDAFDLINAGFDALSARSDFTVDADLLEQRAVMAVRAAERAKAAAAAAAVAEADRCGVPVRNNVRSMSILLAQRTGAPADELAPYKTLGLWMDAFPAIRDAWQAGEITDAHVRHLKSIHSRRTDAYFRRDQHLLVAHAKLLLWDKFRTDCNYWLLHADPDGQLPSERDASYGLKTKTLPNGDVEFHGRLDPITGEAFLNAVDHEDQKLFRQTKNDPDANPQLAKLSHRRRRLVALMNLISRGFERKDGSHPIPLINIVMSESVAEDGNPSGSDEFGCAERRATSLQARVSAPRAERRVERRPSGPTNGSGRFCSSGSCGARSSPSKANPRSTPPVPGYSRPNRRTRCSSKPAATAPHPAVTTGSLRVPTSSAPPNVAPPVSKRAFRPLGPKGE